MATILIIISACISITAISLVFYQKYHEESTAVNEIMSREEQYITLAIFFMIPGLNILALYWGISDLLKK